MNREELLGGCRAFWEGEGRDPIYKVAARLVEASWGDPAAVADALTVLLLVWNQAFYRYGYLDANRIESFLRDSSELLNEFRGRRLEENSASEDDVVHIFADAMEATAAKGKRDEVFRHSPVSVAKSLHLLAPRFFPLWDDAIAKAYRCGWYGSTQAAACCLRFMGQTRETLLDLGREAPLAEIEEELSARSNFPKPMLKFLDEYNYAVYTKDWWSVSSGIHGRPPSP